MIGETSLFEAWQTNAKRAGLPWHGSLELTYRCNERCAMCYLGPDWGKGRKNDELTTAEILDLLDQLRAAGCFDLMLTGGEVCLRKDFTEIVDYAGAKGFVLTIKTNGTLMTPELATVLRRNPVKQVDMSLLGGTADTHDAVTKIPGSFDRTVRAARILRAADVRVRFAFTALKLNFRDLAAARALSQSLDCEFSWNSQIEPRDDRSVIPLALRLDPPDQMDMQALRVKETVEQFGEWDAANYPNDGWFCGAGKFAFNVTPYGDVQPCILMRLDCGNVRERPFTEIWERSPQFQQLRALRIADVYGCNRCDIREYCSACPGLFFMEMGDVTMPSPHICEQAEMRHQAATGVFKACGARDATGQFPRPVNVVLGGAGHQPIPLRVRKDA